MPALAEKIICLSEASYDFSCYSNNEKNGFSDEVVVKGNIPSLRVCKYTKCC